MLKIRSAALAAWDFLICHCCFGILLSNAVLDILIAGVLYFLLPVLSNYPPEFVEYSVRFSIPYWLQFTLLVIVYIIITNTALWLATKDVGKWSRIVGSKEPERSEGLAKIRVKCLNLPYLIYLIQTIIPVILYIAYSIIYSALYDSSLAGNLSPMLMILALFTISSVINYLFSKTLSREILQKTGAYNLHAGRRIKLKSQMMLQVLPVFFVAVLFTSLLGYSQLTKDRGVYLFEEYHQSLDKAFQGLNLNSLKEAEVMETLEDRLKAIDIDGTRRLYFIIKPDGSTFTSDNSKLNSFFVNYLRSYSSSRNGRVYDEFGTNNGASLSLPGRNGLWCAGVKYRISLPSAFRYMVINFIVLLLLSILLFYMFSRSYSTDIASIAGRLANIVDGFDVSSPKRIPVTSNDEIGDLVIAFNKIRDCELEYDRIKNEFIANISHEFRTPMNIILNAQQLLAYYTRSIPSSSDAARINAHLSTMKQNSYRLIKLVNNLIDSTKLDANFLKIHPRNLDLVKLVREVTVSVGAYIQNRGLRLEFSTNSNEIITAADPDAIERVMLNLLSNAVKFNRAGGNISVRVCDKGDHLEILVADSGIGIPEEKLNYIFKRFEQVENTLTKSHEGSGIGLSIVKSLIEMHDGSISVSSKKGESTLFKVTLPKSLLPDSSGDCSESFEGKVDQGLEKIYIEFSDV